MEKLCWNVGHHKIYVKKLYYVLELYNNNKHMDCSKIRKFREINFYKNTHLKWHFFHIWSTVQNEKNVYARL